ncbi:hypothetical protein GWC95_14565 [Sediminibacterium roseum]|uniref:DUF3592 domain-containing protein n=1 Tax=Sediminibacterium roseum TaxID=1978412 RepID=A0ABW9ZVF5_9BACT|nr:hypothetical protein [Sediminibacterium roseum]NCI51152.1 hypothetical protein [Sediminibacterium roseum]
MFGLILEMFRSAIIVGAAVLVCYVLGKIFRKKVRYVTMLGFACTAFLLLVFLKMTSFYFISGGYEYRSLPVRSPVDIKETDVGTFINAPAPNTGAGKYDIDRLAISRSNQTIYFRAKDVPDTVFAYNYKTFELKPAKQQVALFEFDELYSNYHNKIIAPAYFLFVIVCFLVMIFFRKREREKDDSTGFTD